MPAREDKTEPATPKRREEAREKGQVAKSREISSIATLLVGVLFFYLFGGAMGRNLLSVTHHFLAKSGTTHLSQEGAYHLAQEAIWGLALSALPLLLLVLLAGVAANILQIGFLVSFHPLMPKLSKLNPIAGARRLISKGALMELGKAMAKIALVAYISYSTIRAEWDFLPSLALMSVGDTVSYFTGVSLRLGLRTGVVLLVLAALDYAFQRHEYEMNLRMTKQEVRDEWKQREGDPLIKAKVRQVQRELARRRMMEAVPKADVVVTNPSHYAVALSYEREEIEAPMVVAKGAGYIAEKIKEIARAHGVPLVENPPLAQALYKQVPLGAVIPVELYRAVAEVLAYVYRLKGKVAT